LALTTLHVLNALLLDAVENFFLRGVVDVVQDLKLGSLRVLPLPLVDVRWVEGLVVIDKVPQVVSSYCHFYVRKK